MPRMKKIRMWKMPSRKAFEPSGITRGTSVTTGRITGQVWSQAPSTPNRRWWWVVTADGVAHLCEAGELRVLGQCGDTPIANITAA